MRALSLSAVLALVLVVAAPPLCGQSGANGAATRRALADSIAQARALVSESVAGVPGLSIAVGREGRIVRAEGFGWADLEQRVPVRTTTRFRIGSVSKPFTAAAVALLVRRGALDLDRPVHEYVPSFPAHDPPVTTRLAAGHLAGIRHYRGLEFLNARRYDDVRAGLAIFQDDPLIATPGERYSYSSYGWNLVAAVVEVAAEKEFLAFMRDEVFEPLAMRSTGPDHVRALVQERARPYERGGDGGFVNARHVDNSSKWAGGGFLSTPEDMVRFGLAHLEPGFHDAEALELLFTSMRSSAGAPTGYGLGWSVSQGDGRRTLRHGGGSVGGTTGLALYPDTGVVVALVANLSDASLPRAEAIAELFE